MKTKTRTLSLEGQDLFNIGMNSQPLTKQLNCLRSLISNLFTTDFDIKLEKSIKTFRKSSCSLYSYLTDREKSKIPDFFNIRYMHQNKVNPHLNLIKQCVLTKTDVEYGSDRYKAYADGRPQTTKLSLSFQELEIITKDYIEQGY